MPPKKKATTKKATATAAAKPTAIKVDVEPGPTIEPGADGVFVFNGEKMDAEAYIKAVKAAGHVAHINDSGTIDGPSDAPVFIGLPYINADEPDPTLYNDDSKVSLRLIGKDTSGRDATKCAVYVRMDK